MNTLEPVRANQYIMDVISILDRKRVDHHMHFRRVVWLKDLLYENQSLLDMLYNQVFPSVKSGDLLGGQTVDVNLHNQVSLLISLEYHILGNRQPPTWYVLYN